MVSAKINAFVSINDDSTEDLKIVYYAGHSKLSKMKDVVWASVHKTGDKYATVTWTGIQQELQQAQSDVLILLDCCSSGVADGGEGNGVTELLAACPFGTEANGVGHYSFTTALTIELRLFAIQNRIFPIGDLYANLYRRSQSHLAQGISNERYPPPVHLQLRSDERFPRSIQLSVQRNPSEWDTTTEFGSSEGLGTDPRLTNRKRPLASDSPMPSNKHLLLSKDHETSGADIGSNTSQTSSTTESHIQHSYERNLDQVSWFESDEEASTPPCSSKATSQNGHPALQHRPKDSLWPADGNRMLLAVRFTETISAKDLSPKYFADWLRTIPTEVEEVIVEAGFICDSTLLLISLPISMWTYLSDNPAIIPLGRIHSSNLLALKSVSMDKTAEDGMDAEPPVKRDKGKGKMVSFAEKELEEEIPRTSEHSDMDSEKSIETEIEMTMGSSESKEVAEEDFRGNISGADNVYAADKPETTNNNEISEESQEDGQYSPQREGEGVHDLSAFNVSSEAISYVINIRDKFPLADIRLVERLGEANWQRHMSIRNGNWQEPNAIPQEAPQYNFHTKSTFDDSGLGTSLPTHPSAPSLSLHFNEASGVNSLPTRPYYAPSLSSYVSRVSDLDAGYFRVPQTPREVSQQRPFTCFICERLVDHIKNRVEWKLHVFEDIRPYICPFSSCTDALSLFLTRSSWAEHLFEHHFSDTSWGCKYCPATYDNPQEFRMHLSNIHTISSSDERQLSERKLSPAMGSAKCPLCLKPAGKTRREYVSHVSKHMESIALGTLPREFGGETESDSDYCDSVIGQQDATGKEEDADDEKRGSSKAREFFEEEPLHGREQENYKANFLKLEHEEDISYDMNSQPPQLKGGTLLALTEQLTRHDKLDSQFNNTFLMTYRTFTTARQLFDLLVKRFEIQPPEGMVQSDYEIWRDRKQKIIRFRVVNILKTWFDNFWLEDQSDESKALIRDVYTFTRDTIKTTGIPGSGPLVAVLEQRLHGQDPTVKRLVSGLSQSAPQPILPKNMKKLKFLDIDATEYARQLTNLESKLYDQIKPVECLNKAWQKHLDGGDPDPAQNIKALILHSNQLTNWVAEMILAQFDVKKRVMVIKHFVSVADQCRQLNNYGTLTSIISALGTAPIHRMKKTWDQVPKRTTAILESMRRLMGSTKNFGEYRESLHLAHPPCIPFFGVYLTDLTFIEDGMPSFKKSGLINFAKRAKTAEVIFDMQQYQNVPYVLQPVAELQEYILSNMQAAGDVHEMYDRSLEVEPREREEEKTSRKFFNLSR
ncbi:hypothetical protein BP6252_14049 [Coleophoma cylindrospora]|uniref:Ras GEF n=1 Tax=Coleophoma cylindrospora TaxID=1849047 RepID=A0A3D8Q4A3_9HELO|nr:hypothetical protein BP6252_14049 [Coleophoma cylindrospora]